MKLKYKLNARDVITIYFSDVMIEYVGSIMAIISHSDFDSISDDEFKDLETKIANLNEWEEIQLKIVRMPLFSDWTKEDFDRILKRFYRVFEV